MNRSAQTARKRGQRSIGKQRRVKIAVSLPAEHVAEAQRAVNEGLASSVSAYVARAMERQAHADALGELVATMRSEDGRPTSADYVWADRALGIVGSARMRRAD